MRKFDVIIIAQKEQWEKNKAAFHGILILIQSLWSQQEATGFHVVLAA